MSGDTEREQESEEHSRTGECSGEGQIRTLKERKRARGTYGLESAKEEQVRTPRERERETRGHVRTMKARKRARGTHGLESTKGWSSKDTERK
jgi:hypothetical protein